MKEELADYSVDRLGKFDFALHSVGKLLSVSCCTFSICHWNIGATVTNQRSPTFNPQSIKDGGSSNMFGWWLSLFNARDASCILDVCDLNINAACVYSVVYTCKTCQTGKQMYAYTHPIYSSYLTCCFFLCMQPNVYPGQCWAFPGQEGYVTIKVHTVCVLCKYTTYVYIFFACLFLFVFTCL